MKVHDLTKYVWSLFTIYFWWVVPLHPKSHKPKLILDVNPTLNYIEKFISPRIHTVTSLERCHL
jgi:hypothetical protein